MDDYDYYDEKILYLFNLFEKEREIKLENEKEMQHVVLLIFLQGN